MAITVAQAKSLCTASELTLVKASSRTEIGKFSVVEIRQKVDRARKLRDKWRDQSKSQRRATQSAQRARQTDANARSAEKAELFGEVLARFETQLAKLETKGPKGRPAPKRLPTRARSATHRVTRAVVRDELNQSKLALTARQKPAKPKTAKPAKAAPARAAADTFADNEPTESEVGAAKLTKPTKKMGRRKLAAAGIGMTAIEAARAVQGLHVTKGKQLRAQAAAKQDRLQAAGVIRMQMHASSRNRRTQGKRDAR